MCQLEILQMSKKRFYLSNRIISIIVIISVLFFCWFTYSQAKQRNEIRARDIIIIKAKAENDTQTLLDIERYLEGKTKSEFFQDHRVQYMQVLLVLRKFDKIVDVFDKDIHSRKNMRTDIPYIVCVSKYKLNRNGKECAEGYLNTLKKDPLYYNNFMYWLFAILAGKKAVELEQDVHKSTMDKEFLRRFLELEVTEDTIINSF